MIIDYIGACGLPVVARRRGMESEAEAEQEVEVELESEGTAGLGRSGSVRAGWSSDARTDRHSPVPHQAQRSPCRLGRSCEIGGQAWRCWASTWAGQETEAGKESTAGLGGGWRGQKRKSQKSVFCQLGQKPAFEKSETIRPCPV